MPTAIITDSTAYLAPETVQRAENIFVTPVFIQWHGTTFKDMEELKPEVFYHQLAKAKKMPKTSMPNVGNITDLLNKLEKKGYTHVIFIPMSQGISSFYNSLQHFIEWKHLQVKIFNSNSTSGGNEMLVLLASRLAHQKIPVEKIIEGLELLKESLRIEFFVKDLNYLKRTGRVNNIEHVLGSLLRIRPILEIETKNSGQIRIISKERTEKRALSHIQMDLEKDTSKKNVQFPYAAIVFDSNKPETKDSWCAQLKQDFADIRFSTSILGPAIGCHTGAGALGIAWAYDWQRVADYIIQKDNA
jgi:DegV family protein with EDD domain